MLDVVAKPETKAQRIERELLDNPERSDREIGRVVGCDHKTVGSARARMSELLAVGDSPSIVPQAPIEVDDDFDWASRNAVLLEQPETAIYLNFQGSLVIRQYGFPDPDPVIIITAENVGRFIERLRKECNVDSTRR